MRLELILNACNAFVLPNLTITPYLINTHTLFLKLNFPTSSLPPHKGELHYISMDLIKRNDECRKT